MNCAGLKYLQALAPFGMTGDLKNMERLLDVFEHPERKFQTIHVVGTDGKGSTAFYLSRILSAHGISAGLYTSPHLVNVRERIRLDNAPISEEDLNRLLLQVRDVAEQTQTRISFFEALTLACFLYFAEKNVGVAVIEAGLGGRLDSTRTACGKRAVLTSIGMEHTEILGNTEREILHEKMGILSAGATLFAGGISPELVRDAENFSKSLSAKVVFPPVVENLEVPNVGHHYAENASLSLAVACDFLGIAFDEEKARDALRHALWVGRMQKLRTPEGKLRWILDGAHNPHAVKRLAETLELEFPKQKLACVFGALRDKDLNEMLNLLAPHISVWHVTRTPYERFREVGDISSELQTRGCQVGYSGEMSRPFLDKVQEISDGPVLITGSLYMIGSAIYQLKDDFEDLSFFRGMELTESETHGKQKTKAL